MYYLLALLTAFCLSVSPESDWQCSYHPGYGATCDDHTSDMYYRAQWITFDDSYGQIAVITLTDGDAYEALVDMEGNPTIEITK